MITVQLLGGASMRSEDVVLNGPPVQRHRIALLALIVSAWPQPLSRDRAMALLWPERDLAGARRLLNLAVHVLRSALGPDAIASTGDGLLLNPSRLTCDLHALRNAIASRDSEQVIQLYAGPLLDGFHLDDATDFEYWLDQRRAELAHAFIGALLAVAEHREHSGDVHGWVGACRRLVCADPHSGTYAKSMMRALAAAGDRSGVRHHALEYSERMRVDLDLDPDPEVVALAEHLCNAARPHAGASPAARTSSSVAVLPFLNLSADPAIEFFSDGITEDVIAQLSRNHSLKVISRASAQPFKTRTHTMKEIGNALGIGALLDGSVRHSGDRVRIVAKLIDTQADRHLWAETYDRQLTDVFAVQTEVALQISAALTDHLPDHQRAQRITLE